jgi:hypothetical protein
MTATERWRRERELEAMLSPPGCVKHPHLDRAVYLALKHEWTIRVRNISNAIAPNFEANQHRHTIWTSPIHGDVELALFCHEGGHVEDPNPYPQAISIEGELRAWGWAQEQLGRRWSRAMENAMEECLATYRPNIAFMHELERYHAVIKEGRERARQIVRLIR